MQRISRSKQFLVKPHEPFKRYLYRGVVVLCAIAVCAAFYEIGRRHAGYQLEQHQSVVDQLRQEIAQLTTKNSALINDNALLGRSSQIDSDAHDRVKTALTAAQEDILELKEELAFYRSLVSPTSLDPGLHIQNFKLEADGDRAYDYKLVLTQVRNNNRFATGEVDFRVRGFQDEKDITLALSEITAKQDKVYTFKFKYFQSLEGSFNLPEGFMPESIIIRVTSKTKHLKAIEKAYNWKEITGG